MERFDIKGFRDFLEKNGVVCDYKISHTTYCYHDYRIEIVYDLGSFEFGYWLYHKSCGIKVFIFGVPMNDISYPEFLNLVFSRLQDDISFYDSEYNY